MKNKIYVVNNAGMIEIERIVGNLYAKGLVSKDEIKELINNLKQLIDNLPDRKENLLH
jgi:hypothetical protein